MNPGSYHVKFEPAGPSLRSEWYNDAEQVGDSRVVVVAASTTVPNINAQLEAGGSISGRITTAAGAAIAGAPVQVRNDSRTLTVTTDSAGLYTVRGLAGEVTIHVGGQTGWNYEQGYWPNATTFDRAGRVVVENGAALTGYNITLRKLGTVSGLVTTSTRPVAGASVLVSPITTGLTYAATTGTDGRYTVTGVPPGQYRVRFQDVAGALLLGEYWKDVAGSEQATTVTVTDGGAVTGISADLQPAGTLFGVVTDAAGPVAGVTVYVSGRIGTTSVVTDSVGRYVAAVRPGPGTVSIYSPNHVRTVRSYTGAMSGLRTELNIVLQTGVRLTGDLVFVGGTVEDVFISAHTLPASSGDYLGTALVAGNRYTMDHLPTGSVGLSASAYICSPTCTWTQMSATVTLVSGTNEHDLVFTRPGSISGRVTNDAGAGAGDELVDVCDVVGTTTCYSWIDGTVTGADGRYVIQGLPTGRYVVTVRGQTRTVTVAAGSAVADINFVVPRGVTVSGRVTTSPNSPAETGVRASAFSSSTGRESPQCPSGSTASTRSPGCQPTGSRSAWRTTTRSTSAR